LQNSLHRNYYYPHRIPKPLLNAPTCLEFVNMDCNAKAQHDTNNLGESSGLS
jgi:hypothetical protein